MKHDFFEVAVGTIICILGVLASVIMVLYIISAIFCNFVSTKPKMPASSCAGTVKGFYFEDNQIRVVTENGVFIYDDEGHLIKEEKK